MMTAINSQTTPLKNKIFHLIFMKIVTLHRGFLIIKDIHKSFIAMKKSQF